MAVLVQQAIRRETPRLLRHVPALYVVCALWSTILLALLTPPFYVPDETNHSLRALQIAHGTWIAHPLADGATGEADANVVSVGLQSQATEARIYQQYAPRPFPGGRVSLTELRELQQVGWAHRNVAAVFRNTAVYPPSSYLAQALGWRVAERLNLTVVRSALLGRLCGAIACVLVGWAALCLCRCGRPLLFALLLLPTILSLDGSNSQDGITFAMAVLAMAILTGPLSEHRLMHWRESASVTTLLVAVAASRAPYLALAWFPLLPALEKRPVSWRNVRGPLCCTAAVILIVAAWQYRMRPIGMPLATGANPAAQMLMLVRHPWSAVPGLALETLQAVRPMFPGGVSLLGTNDASPPRPYAWALVAATAALIAATPMACLRSRALRAGVFATLFLITTGISVIAWLMWTVAGLHRVDGLQARYFLPLCVWAFLLLPRTSMASGRVQAMLWRGGIATIALLTLSLPWFAARVFYKMGLAAALRLALQ